VDTIPIKNIAMGDRVRKDMGDIDGLSASMSEVGQLQPVLLGRGLKLISGARRVKAAKKLGWDSIGYVLVNHLDEVAQCLKAERDENTQRKPFTKSELGEMASRLLAIEKPAAKARQKDHGGTAPGKGKNTCGKVPQVSGEKSRDKVGKALGVSGKTAEKAAEVVEAAKDDPETFGDLPELMDEKGVKAAHEELTKRQDDPPDYPARLAKFFETVPLFRKAVRAAKIAANLFRECEKSPTYKLANAGQKHTVYSSYLELGGRDLDQMTPTEPCPECGGSEEPSPDADACPKCEGRGFLTVEDVAEVEAAK
jgi:ParB-like chromosome segregation protein Spo0J